MLAGSSFNAMDPNAFGDLKRLARENNSPEALRAAAKQFEALFLQMVLKAMRDATPPNGLFDSDQTRMLQGLHDQQMAMNLSLQGRGTGLADVIFRQLGGEAAREPLPLRFDPDGRPVFDLESVPRRPAITAARARREAISAAEAPATDERLVASSAANVRSTDARSVAERVRAFVDRVRSHALDASRSIGIPAQFMIAQAALESGWGRAELRTSDGRPSYNLFNIKAGRNWKGPVIELPVTEYANGRAHTEKAQFRVYGSYAEAFRDYANLLRNSPRYSEVLGQRDASGFAQSLQAAGYATDPMYADKLTRIIGMSTLRAALDG
ncbi:MAG TPA: flagellar assembly peptidoglycan hydrolase FlgJ [Rhodocyclaceae bacterium]|nr:flagellar assembly peptidoglycan hydrolase FlgJ [Rhodocyclaceae bacterium]HRQ45311.1 flagellar assembly peptidoglycan hydrolase FlgJ [Rhodocyclaceae bacterium]